MLKQNNYSMPSILLLSLNPFFGGGENYLRKLFLLFKAEYEFHAIVCDEQLYNFFKASDIPVVNIIKKNRIIEKIIFFLKMMVFTRRYCQKYKIDLIILNGPAGAYILPGLIGLPVSRIVVRQTELTLSNFLLRIWFIFMAYFADRVVCVSENIFKQLSAYIPTHGLVQIPHWIENPILESLPGINKQDFVNTPNQNLNILFVGRIEKAKGWRELVSAVEGLEGIRVNFVGAGDELEYAKKNISSPSIVFNGFSSRTSEFYRSSDIFVSPSHSEGMPMALLEAMSAGLACLISNIPAHQEVSNHGTAALLFECKSVADLRNKLTSLISNPELRQQLGANAYQRVTSNYSTLQVKKLYYQLFNSLLQKT